MSGAELTRVAHDDNLAVNALVVSGPGVGVHYGWSWRGEMERKGGQEARQGLKSWRKDEELRFSWPEFQL